MKYLQISFLVVLIVVVSAFSADAGWLIYHEPELKGTILDINTKQPLQDAVIVAVYWKSTIGLGAGSIDSIINVHETLTDKDGVFHIPSYTTIIQPFSWQIPNRIIIFKPGYASLQLDLWASFTGSKSNELTGHFPWNTQLEYRVAGHGIVELPKLRSKEDFIRRTLGFPTGYGAKSLPLLYRAYEEEKSLYQR